MDVYEEPPGIPRRAVSGASGSLFSAAEGLGVTGRGVDVAFCSVVKGLQDNGLLAFVDDAGSINLLRLRFDAAGELARLQGPGDNGVFQPELRDAAGDLIAKPKSRATRGVSVVGRLGEGAKRFVIVGTDARGNVLSASVEGVGDAATVYAILPEAAVPLGPHLGQVRLAGWSERVAGHGDLQNFEVALVGVHERGEGE